MLPVFIWKEVIGQITVLANNLLLAGTVLVNNLLLAGTVLANNLQDPSRDLLGPFQDPYGAIMEGLINVEDYVNTSQMSVGAGWPCLWVDHQYQPVSTSLFGRTPDCVVH